MAGRRLAMRGNREIWTSGSALAAKRGKAWLAGLALWLPGVCLAAAYPSSPPPLSIPSPPLSIPSPYPPQPAAHAAFAFAGSAQCIACHSGLADAEGADVSIGHAWQATMMAHSAKDPYWQASVRRELLDHPGHQAAIEDVCATCHMPMARVLAQARGEAGQVFAHLGDGAGQDAELALEGVSCTVCHQIADDNFGEPSSFDGGFRIAVGSAAEPPVFGPFDIDDGRRRIMQSASGFSPETGIHVQQSELCATCHTLFTEALDGAGGNWEPFPEQTPYLEWRHSSYYQQKSCQDCHMPEAAPAPIASVLGDTREGLSQHAFRGGNAFMLRLLDRYRDALGVTAPSAALQRAAAATEDHLRNETARLDIAAISLEGSDLLVDLRVRNLAGHKLPTAYPSRRAWLHLQVADQRGATLFESGALGPDGAIAGNDNDADPLAFEPHHQEISSPEQVQIYEPIIADGRGQVTTGLLRAVRYLKDNRLLPAGFDKSSAERTVAAQGAAADDEDFRDGGDAIRYRIALDDGVAFVTVSARLLFQSIGFRWARNLDAYDSFETDRFAGYYRANAAQSAVALAQAQRRYGLP